MDKFDEIGRQLARQIALECGADFLPEDVVKLATATLRAAATVPPGHVRVGTEDMRLLGTLPMTADGCVIGTNADLYSWWVPQYTDDEGICQHSSTGPIVSAPHQCYSTQAAALAAKGAPDAK